MVTSSGSQHPSGKIASAASGVKPNSPFTLTAHSEGEGSEPIPHQPQRDGSDHSGEPAPCSGPAAKSDGDFSEFGGGRFHQANDRC